MIQTNCTYYNGDKPCTFHKKYLCECNEGCIYYKKIEKRILIIKKEAIGDVLRTTPIIYSIRKKFGEKIHITWLINKESVDLLKYNPYIDRIYEFSFKTIIYLEIEEFDIVYNLDKDLPSLAIAKKIKAVKKYGFTMNKFGNLITFNEKEEYAHRLGISDKLKKENNKSYQEIICELLELPYDNDFKYIFKIKNKKKIIENLIIKYGIERNSLIIGLNTGAGAKFLTKIWPTEYFIKLAKMLITQNQITILLFGSNLEKKKNKQIYNTLKQELPNTLKSKIIDTGINNSLFELAALISLTKILISGDTLGLHIAIALEKPSISIFGPTSYNEIDLYGNGIKIIADSPCLMCYRKKCNYETFCLSKISPELIYEKTLFLLEKVKKD